MIRDQDNFDQFLQSVRRFVRERLLPREDEVAQTDAIPPDLVQGMRELGLFGLSIPERFGGLDLTLEETVLVIAELCRASAAYRSFTAGNVGVASQTILLGGTEQQQQEYLPDLASGRVIGSFCLTEPEAGSDAASVKTRAIRDGDSYVINGTKRFITNSPHAGLYVVVARTDPATRGASGVSAFAVRAGTPGLSTGKPMRKMGQQGAQIADVIFEDCRIPAANLLGGREGQGFHTAMQVLDKGRLHIAAVALGIAQRALEEGTRYALQRVQFGKPLADFQMVKAMLADSQADIYAARCMMLDAARRRDLDEDITLEASCCKLFATEMCGRVVDRTVQIHGGSGYVAEFAAERLYRDARVLRIYEGASDIQRLVIARELLRRHAAQAD
ncbi:MAG: acyl-CoA dehydrogenase family protein [Burkholderiaceae bacterium]|nr:acyl-CoA dehydrogenase family protein [Burkholderiaceae bacterium]